MTQVVNVGVIGCDMSEDFFQLSRLNKIEKFNWKKIYCSSDTWFRFIKKGYPEAEIVQSVQSVVSDADITLVFISSSHLDYVSKVMETGKSVRIIS